MTFQCVVITTNLLYNEMLLEERVGGGEEARGQWRFATSNLLPMMIGGAGSIPGYEYGPLEGTQLHVELPNLLPKA